MAQKITTTLIDDIDGSRAHERVTFALDGVVYMIDLNADHAERLRTLLSDYIAVARRTGGRPQGKPAGRPTREIDPKAVREWAKGEGIEISDYGRISADVIQEYLDSDARSKVASAVTSADARTTKRQPPKTAAGSARKR